ncbi:hypothetical protein L6232_22575, partial [Shewanella sp. C31]|nr:hypothetical protein [Shewanella electrica]
MSQDVKSSLYVLQQGLRHLAGGGFVTLVLPPAARVEPHTLSVRKAVEGLIEGASRTLPGVRVNGGVPSRDPAGEAHDQALVRAALGLGS